MFCVLTLIVLGQISLFDELSPLYPDTSVSSGASQWSSDTACDWPTGVHVLVDSPGQQKGILRVLDETGQPIDDLAVFRLHDVPVEENTGLDSRTEQFKDTINPHVIRRAPFRIYEALEPLDVVNGTVMLPEDVGPLAFRFEVKPQAPGTRSLRIELDSDQEDQTLAWSIRTHDWRSPPREDLGFGYTNWFSPTVMAERHGVKAWSEDFWPVLASYAALMARGGQDTFWMRWPDFFDSQGDTWVLDESRLDRYINIFLDAGFHVIEGAPVARRPGGDWSSETLELSIPRVPATGEEGRRILADLSGQLRVFMSTRDWMDHWIQHIADEPTDVNAEDYRLLSAQLHALLPGVPVIEATMTRSLVGAVDIWCPQVHKFQQNRVFFEERQAAGDRVWTYTCLVPGGPWLNRLLDQERLRSVYFAWAAERFQVQGFLHWGLNHYKADPFKQSVVDHPAMPETTNKLPAGDTHVVFPGPEGPWSSTRFEAQRIGLEDLTALRALRESDSEHCQRLIDHVFRGYDSWEDDVEVYRGHRRALLEAVSANSGQSASTSR
ncbi:MAG: DUF4091 domain-containing protein [Planctomycetota bacterium]|nr:DUF4091 domain-containing protein [Planctomycetota bacterium]